MQIHELEVFVGNLDENTFFAVDDGTETAKLSADNILPVAMTVAEAALGTETATRVIAPSVFKEAVDTIMQIDPTVIALYESLGWVQD